MQIIESIDFKRHLQRILDFLGSKSKASKDSFSDSLYENLSRLDFMPYKFRKSWSFDDEDIRDFIFKGYVIPYFIDKQNDKIVLLAIFRENLLNF